MSERANAHDETRDIIERKMVNALSHERLAELVRFAGYCRMSAGKETAEQLTDLIAEVLRLRKSLASERRARA